MAKTSRDDPREREYASEAERLAQLPLDVQRKAVALIRAPADDPKLSKADRAAARDRADALDRHLRRLNSRKKKM
ncbi:MAG TPA: hypothetical protein VE988_14480 [Gemmataceae bacterium]|nr:hypothetical protein [Gemmataceae bacterium]